MAEVVSPPRRPRWVVAAAGGLALVVVTAALVAIRARLELVHVALVYLLVVLGGSAVGGRALGLVLAAAAFLAFNFFFIPPYHTLGIADPRDWIVLVAFLVTGIVAAQLLYRAQAEAAVARRRASEVDRLATLGAETLSAGRADAALAAIARVIQTTLGVRACDVFIREAATGRLAPAARAGAGEPDPPPSDADGAAGDGRALLIPLAVRERVVGMLRLADDRPIALDPTRRRYLDALAYYAALGVERMRLTAEAERVEALREADRLKDSLLASVSHDLRTPLTTIRALAHEIAGAGDERALVIEEEVDRLNRFVADLLDLSRLGAGGVPLSIALNAAEDLMGAALQRVGGMAAGREIRAALGADEPVLVGRFDFAQSLRVVVNLLENALRYAPAGAPIDFTARRDGDALVFAVADRGPGVPLSEARRIFAPFYRPPGAPADAGAVGLGLAIAHALAVAQGGTITYEPRAGGGSVFSLRLPAADLAEAGLDLA